MPLCLQMDFTQTFLGNHGTIKVVESKVIFYQIRELQVAGNATTTGWLELVTRYTVNIYMYKTIQARVNTVAIPTTGKYCSLYQELLKPLWVIYQ